MMSNEAGTSELFHLRSDNLEQESFLASLEMAEDGVAKTKTAWWKRYRYPFQIPWGLFSHEQFSAELSIRHAQIPFTIIFVITDIGFFHPTSFAKAHISCVQAFSQFGKPALLLH
jgi:hypothetical protein